MRSFGYSVAVLYGAAVFGFVFAALESPRVDSLASSDAVTVAWAFAHVLVGFAIGRWWAVALAALPVLVAVPADAAYYTGEPPIWLSMLVVGPLLAALIAGGVGVRRLAERTLRRDGEAAA